MNYFTTLVKVADDLPNALSVTSPNIRKTYFRFMRLCMLTSGLPIEILLRIFDLASVHQALFNESLPTPQGMYVSDRLYRPVKCRFEMTSTQHLSIGYKFGPGYLDVRFRIVVDYSPFQLGIIVIRPDTTNFVLGVRITALTIWYSRLKRRIKRMLVRINYNDLFQTYEDNVLSNIESSLVGRTTINAKSLYWGSLEKLRTKLRTCFIRNRLDQDLEI